MHKTPTATVSAGPVSPKIMGPDRDLRETYILSGLVLFVALVVAGFWYYSQTDEAAHNSHQADQLESSQVSEALKSSGTAIPVAAAMPATPVEAAPLATRSLDILHDDITFEVGRKGLTDDAKATLQRHAEFLKNEPDWGVLLQGYTDLQGSRAFNQILGMKRAETVKQQLIALGVSEHAIRTVSLGEEGALCIDGSDLCRRMNRRVHLEMRNVGREHLAVAPIAAVPVVEAAQDDSTETSRPEDGSVMETGSSTDSVE